MVDTGENTSKINLYAVRFFDDYWDADLISGFCSSVDSMRKVWLKVLDFV